MPAAFQVMLYHSLLHEHEEIGGLLVGKVDENQKVCVTTVIPCKKTSKKRDRVEISAVELSKGIEKCEDIAKTLKQSLNIIGWYHSHPHITPFPSHVDIATQFELQGICNHFIGLIVAVFDQSGVDTQNISILGFQSTSLETQVELKVTIGSGFDANNEYLQIAAEALKAVTKCCADEETDFLEKNNDGACTVVGVISRVLSIKQQMLSTGAFCDYMTKGLSLYADTTQ